ncbi:MAG: hypothetical protein KatS3mg058_0579 [Roseiflexus sp.]|nr:MAG: hypothetical protein KatS3mg058_0579 [Roseiflexus sp.]
MDAGLLMSSGKRTVAIRHNLRLSVSSRMLRGGKCVHCTQIRADAADGRGFADEQRQANGGDTSQSAPVRVLPDAARPKRRVGLRGRRDCV